MKLFDLCIRILKKQIWLYLIYLAIFMLFLMLAADMEGKLPSKEAIAVYYRYAVPVAMVLIILTISAVTAVTSDTDLFLRHQAAPVRLLRLELAYVGADLLVMLFWWMLFFWTAVVLYGEAAYSTEGFLMAVNLLAVSLFSAAVGFITGILAKTVQGRGIAANLIAFGLPFAGGSLISMDREDETVYLLRSFSPVFWYQRALEELTCDGGKMGDFNHYAVCVGIQLIFAVMVLILGMLLEKQKKENAN